MENNNKNTPEERDLNLERDQQSNNLENTADTNKQHDNKHGSADRINSIISSPTQNVRARHTGSTWANTGTNISYEGQTAPGAGGSVGTGQASGQDATGASYHTESEYELGRAEHKHEKKESDKNPDLKEDDKGYSKKGDNKDGRAERDII